MSATFDDTSGGCPTASSSTNTTNLAAVSAKKSPPAPIDPGPANPNETILQQLLEVNKEILALLRKHRAQEDANEEAPGSKSTSSSQTNPPPLLLDAASIAKVEDSRPAKSHNTTKCFCLKGDTALYRIGLEGPTSFKVRKAVKLVADMFGLGQDEPEDPNALVATPRARKWGNPHWWQSEGNWDQWSFGSMAMNGMSLYLDDQHVIVKEWEHSPRGIYHTLWKLVKGASDSEWVLAPHRKESVISQTETNIIDPTIQTLFDQKLKNPWLLKMHSRMLRQRILACQPTPKTSSRKTDHSSRVFKEGARLLKEIRQWC